jgi:hypothetical protein
MRSAIAVCLVALFSAACQSAAVSAPPRSVPEALTTDAFALIAEADRLAVQDLWPAFEPRTVPAAIYDGARTLLFRHPAPPEGFQPVPGHNDVWAYPGRHPSITANASEEIGGTRTATLMLPSTGLALRAGAGILIHEKFHVFQRKHHPGWGANEVELFTYPVDDAALLALRRQETDALRRAVSAPTPERAACWARTALDLRRTRYSGLPEGSVEYERQTELHEGLAAYVERRATGEPDSTVLPAQEFAPEAVRQRAYQTGTAIARLLDRVSPTWRTALEQNDSTPLDGLLVSALATYPASRPACALAPVEQDSIRVAAAADVRELHVRRAEQRRTFLEQPGWTLVITAPGAPLFPQGFDPLNVQPLGDGEVLHTRWLKLGNGAAMVEVLGRAALTRATGDHPLFNGVRSLTITGLASEPTATSADGTLALAADGVSAELQGASIERAGRTVTVRLPT